MTAAFFRISSEAALHTASRNALFSFRSRANSSSRGRPCPGKGGQSALRRLPGLLHPPPQHALVNAQIFGYPAYGFFLLFYQRRRLGFKLF
jgi:hypothetical protein